MAIDERYRQQVELLVRTLPSVAAETVFALKGGTAINLFVRDLPRLSVDIDLTYLPVKPRNESLTDIDETLQRIGRSISESLSDAKVFPSRLDKEGTLNRLIVRSPQAQIKIEVTPVTRGCVFEPTVMAVSEKVEEQFSFAETLVVSFDDLYAGKLVAALDRQHPRDLFDVTRPPGKRGGQRHATASLPRLHREPQSPRGRGVGTQAKGYRTGIPKQFCGYDDRSGTDRRPDSDTRRDDRDRCRSDA